VLGSPCLVQTLDYSNIERLEDHFEVKNLTLGHAISFEFHISLYWHCLGPLPLPLLEMLDFIEVIQTSLDGLCIHIIASLFIQ